MTTINHVSKGKDRCDDRLIVEGVVPLDRKLTTSDTSGGMLIYEHKDVGKGGLRVTSITNRTSGCMP